MSKETVYFSAKVHCKGNTHEGGYCSDPYDFKEIDTTTDEEIDVPNKQFVRDYCDEDGNVEYEGLVKLSSEYRICSGSGYCGTNVVRNVTKAKLTKRKNNFKEDCLNAMSSDEEIEAESNEAPNYARHVNAFRGRFNSTYTSNPGWYNSKQSKKKSK